MIFKAIHIVIYYQKKDRFVKIKPAIICHSGAWSISKSLEKESIDGVETAVNKGWNVLVENGSAIDAVEIAVNSLEENPIFDAGI